jgi:hypothetical protein
MRATLLAEWSLGREGPNKAKNGALLSQEPQPSVLPLLISPPLPVLKCCPMLFPLLFALHIPRPRPQSVQEVDHHPLLSCIVAGVGQRLEEVLLIAWRRTLAKEGPLCLYIHLVTHLKGRPHHRRLLVQLVLREGL